MNQKMKLTYEQLAYIVEKTDVKDPQKAVEYFAEIMVMERIHPSKMPECVSRLMAREKRKLK